MTRASAPGPDYATMYDYNKWATKRAEGYMLQDVLLTYYTNMENVILPITL